MKERLIEAVLSGVCSAFKVSSFLTVTIILLVIISGIVSLISKVFGRGE